MANGWAGDGAVQEQIDSTVDDAVQRARSRLHRGASLTHCEECGDAIPEARRQAVGKELQPLVTAFNTARAAPNANQASLQQQATTIQTREQAAQAEIQRITLPAQRAQAYAIEQISAKLPDAVQAVVRARNVSMLVRPDAVLFAGPTADVTSAITTELDRLVPTVSVTPPANWQPGQQQGASAAAAPAAAPAARPAQPAGR